MKTIIKFLVIPMLFTIGIITSCTSDDYLFSCDTSVNSWVENNLTEIKQMTRENWLAIDNPEVARACFRAFSPQQRAEFWIDKLKEVQNLDWNIDEKNHISELIEFLSKNANIFSDYADDRILQDKTDTFLYLWIEKCREQFNWTNNTIYGIIASGHPILDKTGRMQITNTSEKMMTRSGTSDCSCSTSSDWCVSHALQIEQILPIVIDGIYDLENVKCIAGGCNLGSLGCGTLFLGKCDGTCYMPYKK